MTDENEITKRNGFCERFEIGSPLLGVLDYVSTLAEAAQYLRRLEGSDYDDVMVFDRMARIGAVDMRRMKNGRLVGFHRRERVIA